MRAGVTYQGPGGEGETVVGGPGGEGVHVCVKEDGRSPEARGEVENRLGDDRTGLVVERDGEPRGVGSLPEERRTSKDSRPRRRPGK